MNNTLLTEKKHSFSRIVLKTQFLTATSGKSSINVRQLVLVSRILLSLITIGFIGYTVDRFIHSLQNTP